LFSTFIELCQYCWTTLSTDMYITKDYNQVKIAFCLYLFIIIVYYEHTITLYDLYCQQAPPLSVVSACGRGNSSHLTSLTWSHSNSLFTTQTNRSRHQLLLGTDLFR